MTSPSVSVILVSDYAGGAGKSWDDLRRALPAWAAQDYREPVEFVLAESARHERHVPEDLRRLLPSLRFLYFDAGASYELKNRAFDAVSGEIVAIVDADCVPGQGWLRNMVRVMNEQPSAVAVSARTLYPGRTRIERILGLLSRSYLDPGRAGFTHFISGNASAFRRQAYRAHPLPEGLGAFASRIQSEAMLRDGMKFYFEPAMSVVHDFEGWSMERDIRRNHGFCTVATRLEDSRLPHAGLVRMGMAAIPLITAGKTFDGLRDCLRCFRHYAVHWSELPLAFIMVAIVHVMEIPGMITAYRRQAISETAYR